MKTHLFYWGTSDRRMSASLHAERHDNKDWKDRRGHHDAGQAPGSCNGLDVQSNFKPSLQLIVFKI